MGKKVKIEKEDMIKEFVVFLKKHNAYTKFLSCAEYYHRCFNHYYSKTQELSIKSILLKKWKEVGIIESGNLLSSSFSWSLTKEGFEYWANLQRQWELQLYE